MSDNLIQQFPHCDSRILHAPTECNYCDRHPDWQELRQAWGINFTGHNLEANEYGTPFLPCPSEVARPLSNINQWDGNVPFKGDQINTKSSVFPPNAKVFHDPSSRHVHVETAARRTDTETDYQLEQLDRTVDGLKGLLENLRKIVRSMIQ
jgi:hypothetical protein